MKLVRTIIWRLYCYGLFTLLTSCWIFLFFAGLSLTPLLLVSTALYRQAYTVLFRVFIIGDLCIPVAWRGLTIHCNNFGRMREASGKNVLLLCNHSSRIDWLIAQCLGTALGERVGFITEAFIMCLPFVGWLRFLCGDMYVFRSFKRDKERLNRNIMSFHETNTKRWIFLCPEGHIADFGDADKEYISNCEKFSASFGHKAFSMVLTPRYKGMLLFNKIMTKGETGVKPRSISATCTYTQNGQVLPKPLRSMNRIIPDLWTLVQGNLVVYIHMHNFEVPSEPEKIKNQLMQEYAEKDKLMRIFYLTGCFPAGHPDYSFEECPEDWKPILDPQMPMHPDVEHFRHRANLNLTEEERKEASKIKVDHGPSNVWQTLAFNRLEMHASFFLQVFLMCYILHMIGGSAAIFWTFSSLYCVLAVSHIIGELLSGGQSRESLPLEGIIKAFLFRWIGRE